MVHTRKLLVLSTAFAVLATVGCGEDEEKYLAIEPQTTTQSLEQNLEDNIGGLADAMLFLDQSDFMFDMMDMFPSTLVTADAPTPDPIDPTVPPVPEEPRPSVDMRPDAAELVAFLRDEIFTDVNIEKRDGTSITYRLPAELLCTSDIETVDPQGNIIVDSQTDPDCVDMLQRIPVRFRVRSLSAGNFDIDLLISDHNHNPLHFEIYQNSIAVELDLADTRAAVVTVMETMANGEPVELPEVMEGRLRLELVRNAPGDFTAKLSVTQAIKVRFTVEGSTIAVDIAKAADAASARVDATNRTLTLAVDWNAVDISIPANMMGGSSMTCTVDSSGIESCYEETTGPSEGTMEIHLGGASGTTTLNAAAETLVLENLGLGDTTTTVSIDNKPLIGIDLNAAAGRRFNATLSRAATGMQIEVTPSFDLAIALTMQNLADQITDMAAWTLNDTLHVTLDGATAPTIIGHEGGIEVVAGTLTLSSSATTVTVAAGQCLAETPQDPTVEPAVETHPFEQLTSGVCQ